MAFLISQTARCDLLTLLAKADALGRRCAARSDLLTQVELFREYCLEQDCLLGPRQFPSSHSRFQYFRTAGRDPNYLAHDRAKCRVTIMSGLPGSGKDRWIERHAADLPQISLDKIRGETGAGQTGVQGAAVVQAAREKARAFLRPGKDFVWNATNVSREIRAQIIGLMAAYEARIRVVSVESAFDALFARNQRKGAVPRAAVERMLSRWEVPDPAEAQQVEWRVDGACVLAS
jgi:predicted kinase